MAQGYEFICTSCLMASSQEDDQSKKVLGLNSTADIAFSMPDSMFEELRRPLQENHSELSKEMNDKRDLICCITWEDVDSCLVKPWHEGKVLVGTYTLTGSWLKKNCVRFKLTPENVADLPDDMFLLQKKLGFYHSNVADCRFPEKIRDWDSQVVISNERRCIKCGQRLSPDTGRAKELRILLQGSSRAGKTSAILAIVSKLLEKGFDEDDVGFRAQLTLRKKDDGEDVSRYHEWLAKEIEYYQQSIKVEKTDQNQDKIFLYSLLVRADSKKLVLTFVDMPGEYFDKADEKDQPQEKEKLLKLYAPIYNLCDVVWTCLRYETVVSQNMTDAQWQKLENDTGLSKELASYTEYRKYRSRLDELTKEFNDRGFTQPKHAVILTMTDSIVSVYAPSDEELQNMRSNHIIPAVNDKEEAPELITITGCDRHMVFLERSCYNLCHRISNYISQKNRLLHKLFNSFSPQTKYFAIAAYGHPALDRPTGETTLQKTNQKPHPYHIELPLLWTMAVCGYLPIQYEIKLNRKLGFLERLRQGRTTAPAGKQMHICNSFSESDPATVRNLLHENETYQEHFRTL